MPSRAPGFLRTPNSLRSGMLAEMMISAGSPGCSTLTGCRSTEVGGMAWGELDLGRGVWTIPASRTKNQPRAYVAAPADGAGDCRIVPRWSSAINCLASGAARVYALADRQTRLDPRVGVADWRLHDFRRTVATGMADLGIQPHIIEAVLNHYSGHKAGVAGIYNRSTYDVSPRRVGVMGDHVRTVAEGGERKILPLRG